MQLYEFRQIFRKKLCDGRGVGGNPDMSTQPIGKLAHIRFHLLDEPLNGLSISEEFVAGRSEINAALTTVKQRRSDRLFKVGYAFAHGRSRNVLGFGRSRDIVMERDSEEKLQRVEIVFHTGIL